ncbi:Toxin ParE1 [compost metagenome]
MPELRLKPRARRDLNDIWLYSRERWSEEQADRYYAALSDALKSLLVDANRGSPLDVRRGYRKLASGSHFIYYRAIPAGVEVVRILHQAMDAKRHL